MNIIYSNNTLRLIHFNDKETYQLDDLFFYLPKNINGTVYCRIVDLELKENILKLVKVSEDNNYFIYKISLDNHIDTQPGINSLYLLIISDNIIQSSNKQQISIAYDNFTIGRKLYLIEELPKAMKEYFEKIEKLTHINIQLYKDIREANGIND